MKDLLRQMLEGYSKAVCGKDFDVWHNGKFFDNWVDEDITEQLKTAYGTYDSKDILRALNNTIRIFSKVSRKTVAILDYAYPITAETYALEQTKILLRNVNRESVFSCVGICLNPISRSSNPLIFKGFFVALICAWFYISTSR